MYKCKELMEEGKILMLNHLPVTHGSFQLDFPIPPGFLWVYPLACGGGVIHKPLTLAAKEDGLLLQLCEGEGEVQLDEQSGGYLPGCVAFAPPRATLTLYPQERTEYRFVRLAHAQEQFGWAMRDGFLVALPEGSGVEELFARLCDDARDKRLDEIWEASARAFALLMRLCACCTPQAAAYSPLVREALALLRRDFAFLEGVDGLAAQLGVSKNHLIRQFTAQVGSPPGKYLQQVRLENAKQFLGNPSYSIEMVAGMCGFASGNYFCKVFRRAYGESPGEYRLHRVESGYAPTPENAFFYL